MGHYASEMGIGPSDYDLRQEERLRVMRRLLGTLPMSRFTADYAYDLATVMSPRPEYKTYVDYALDRLEALLAPELE